MDHFVYIIQSLKDQTLYKGYSNAPYKRLSQHNAGESRYTSRKTPWKLVYVEKCASKTEALQREKTLKRASRNTKIPAGLAVLPAGRVISLAGRDCNLAGSEVS